MRRKAGSFVVMVLTAAFVGITFGHATADFSFERLVGADRYGTAAVTARATFAASPNAVLTTGEKFPDALAGSYVAALGGGPVLLTRAAGLPQSTIDAMQGLGTRTVVILGGTGAVSTAVEDEVRSRGIAVRRIAGSDRYETARLAAESGGSARVGSPDGKKTAILANGENYPDALSTGPLSFAGPLPLLLTTPGSLSPQAKAAFVALGIKQVLIPGGTAAVSNAVADELRNMSIEIVRFAGATRTETATLVADWALANMSFSESHVNLARGNDFADALAGGPHGGQEDAPILLTTSERDLGDATRRWLRNHSATLEDGHIFGGTSAVSSSVEADAVAAGRNMDPPTTTLPVPTTPTTPGTPTTTAPTTTTTTKSNKPTTTTATTATTATTTTTPICPGPFCPSSLPAP